MNRQLAERIADTIMYEGYILYPYRTSATKNRQRWTFGNLYPPRFEEVSKGTENARMHSECLLIANPGASLHIQLRFLHFLSLHLSDASGKAVTSLLVDDRSREARDEGVPRSIGFDVTNLDAPPQQFDFSFPAICETEFLHDSNGVPLGTQARIQHEVVGNVSCSANRIRKNLYKLSIDAVNETAYDSDPADRNQALLRSLGSAHTLLSVESGEFISLLEPADEFTDVVSACKQVGNFPVLVGEAPERDMLLCSPILLYDYPQIAPESSGDFFDATEMDEMLTLRVMTLTDDEKDAMRFGDEHVRNLLQRTEESAREQLMRTHGTIRSMRPAGGENG